LTVLTFLARPRAREGAGTPAAPSAPGRHGSVSTHQPHPTPLPKSGVLEDVGEIASTSGAVKVETPDTPPPANREWRAAAAGRRAGGPRLRARPRPLTRRRQLAAVPLPSPACC
jgi:hypothetical protein